MITLVVAVAAATATTTTKIMLAIYSTVDLAVIKVFVTT